MKKELPEFDILLEMAEKRPEQLELLRAELIDDIISSANEDLQRRLRGLQFKVDATRRTAKTPLASCMKISSMMHDSLEQLREALNKAANVADQAPLKTVKTSRNPAFPVYSQSELSRELTGARDADSSRQPSFANGASDNVISIFTYRARRSQSAKEAHV